MMYQSQATVHPVAGYSVLHIQSTKNPDAGKADEVKRIANQMLIIATRRKEVKGNNQSQQQKIQPVAKQLTKYIMKIHQSWMSTAELISNVEDDKKPAKERTQGQLPESGISSPRSGISDDDISSDVITISSCEEKRKSWISDDEVSSDVSKQQRATVQPAVGIHLGEARNITSNQPLPLTPAPDRPLTQPMDDP
ncbi:hypothetical protein F511_38778 [Dorcoceras hygrometricum]|uniref:Uncharacterized protein n=1 Tax=Dorcoceras hygrometricum TaxID=472368 RepID=A0A2Z7C6W6_9LAMI|nr:hypothetical protein F511_38778 [Dorcoceras hygrometricum]